METISGGPSEEFLPDTILQAAKLNKALENWVVTEVPGDDVGEIGDVVFVTGDGDGGSSSTAAPGLVHLHTETFSNVASVSLDNVFTSKYQNYLVVWTAVSDSMETDVYVRLRSSGVDKDTARYSFYNHAQGVNNSNYDQASTGAAQFTAGRVGPNGTSSLSMSVYSPAENQRTTISTQNVASGTTTVFVQHGGGCFVDTDSFDGFNIWTASNPKTGKISVYGYSKGGK